MDAEIIMRKTCIIFQSIAKYIATLFNPFIPMSHLAKLFLLYTVLFYHDDFL